MDEQRTFDAVVCESTAFDEAAMLLRLPQGQPHGTAEVRSNPRHDTRYKMMTHKLLGAKLTRGQQRNDHRHTRMSKDCRTTQLDDE